MSKHTSIVVALAFGISVTSAAQSKPPPVEPEAMAALDKMGTHLRSLRSFSVHASSDTDQVLDSGAKITLSASADIRVRRPDRLRADVISDRKQRQFFYDGKRFTINGQRVGYYATVPAPATLAELVETLHERYGIELPVVDLFYWGTDKIDASQITDASYIGPARLGTVEADHYAFRQPGLDWQIWIQSGASPLPLKLVLTNTDDPARPTHTVTLAWKTGIEHPDATFAFVPPKGSHAIALAELGPPQSARTDKPSLRTNR